MKMRIAFFADNFYPELSGIADSILITGKELTKRGHEVVFVGPHYTPKNYSSVHRQHSEKDGQEFVNDIPVVRLPSLPLPLSPTGQSRIALPTGASFAFLKKFKPDIIHTNSPYGCGIEAMRAAKKFNIPLIGTNHTPIEEFYPLAPNLMRHFDVWYYNHCAFITTPFTKLIERMREVGFNKPAKALANPVVRSIFNPPSEHERITIQAKLNLPGPTILYVGRVATEKHIDLVLKSVAALVPNFPTIKFVITGHGIEVVHLQNLAQKLKIAEHVLFTGFIPPENLALYYKAADVFVIMSTADSQSIAMMQAYASEVPAIGARAHGLPDYIPEDVGFLVEPGNIDQLTEKIGELLNNEDLRVRMGRAANMFIDRMSPEKIAAEWEEIYKEVIGRSTSSTLSL